jgi:hypothetical protein
MNLPRRECQDRSAARVEDGGHLVFAPRMIARPLPGYEPSLHRCRLCGSYAGSLPEFPKSYNITFILQQNR